MPAQPGSIRSAIRSSARGIAALTVLGGCTDPATTIGGTARFSLVFRGDVSFVEAHAGRPIRVALLPAGAATDPIAVTKATVSGAGAPTFSVELTDIPSGSSLDVLYWIDAGRLIEDRSDTLIHDPATQTDVCDTFG